MKSRNVLISIFVVVWLLVFYYESSRVLFLAPWLQRPLPKVKFLFPPAGWIMFYKVEDNFGYVEVHGIKDGRSQWIDPHQILQTRAIGYDNINRNALITVASADSAKSFCAFLQRRFPYFDNFMITYVNYPSLRQQSMARQDRVLYECK